MKAKKTNFLLIFIISSFCWQNLTALTVNPQAESQFLKQEMAWREKRDQKMRSATSWLTIAGLFWLEEGENSFGTSPENRIKLPPGSAPAQAGKFMVNNSKVTVIAAPGIDLKINGQKIKKADLQADDSGKPDIIELNDLRLWVIKRGQRLAIRLRDFNNPAYKEYTGLDFFPPSLKFKLEGNFVAYKVPKKIKVPTMVATEAEMISPGYVTFQLNGHKYRLQAFQANPANTKLFFIFKDQTNGRETYEASRFMVSDLSPEGKVDLNFNRAYNPPCAYTPYATCPLPPPQNYLPVRIEAGEKKYPGSHH
ncbi:MAG: DUF1684 domain-containing protein [Candidatus Aminicenantales bacterium]